MIVLITILFTSSALLLFVERASTDLLVPLRDSDRLRLRQEAYSALETTLAVLLVFEEALGGLHSTAEGWDKPLEWGDYEPADGLAVEVTFQDESGKVPLPRADFQSLVTMFVSWGAIQPDAELWADALLGWMNEDYAPVSFDAPREEDYERADLAYLPPKRPLRSFQELRAIAVINEAFFNENGVANEYGIQFMESVSLLDYDRPNINSAASGVLTALAGYDVNQLKLLDDYRSGGGAWGSNGPGFFTDANEIATVLGEQAVTGGFGATIEALRINVTVRQGPSAYLLSVVISPSGGARLVEVDPIPMKEADRERQQAREDTSVDAGRTGAATDSEESAEVELEYPFTLLEIRENDAPSAQAVVPEEAPI